ncbi:MAG: Spy/CpxP family protein refolding chaperone [Hyphomicrobium sp.]|uniref:Spy/CpxP family protein refolding chaperone n=1 Tax=Hyphomicrobium sp. TaxID=82 RepID=UPI0039E68C94
MKNLSRGTWIALAAIAAVPATVAIARTADNGGWPMMSPETRSRIEDGKLAMVKTALQLTPDQEKLWAPVETQVRDAFKAREARIEEWKKKREERKAEGEKGGEHKRADLASRFEKMSQRMGERADRMKAFSTAFSPFYASLSDEQKDVLRPLIRELSPGFGGPRGHRFAGGWGPGGRHGGWFGHDGPRDHGGPGMHDNGDNDGGPGPDQAPAEPDKKG